MATLTQIRKQYGVPAKHGMYVASVYGEHAGLITGAPRDRMLINVKVDDDKQITVHPFELIYFVPGLMDDESDMKVIDGRELRKKYDAAWDRWNERNGGIS